MDTSRTDPLGRAFIFHDRTWFGHILRGHPEMTDHRALVEAAITNPLQIRHSASGTDSRLYFGESSSLSHMILVVADIALGLVKTAHIAKRFTGGDIEWLRSTTSKA